MRGLSLPAIALGISAAILFDLSQHQPSRASAHSLPQAPSATTPGETIKIFVSVRDKEGRAVRDLSPQDLHVFEKGQPLGIEKLELAPLAVGLLIDTSASRRMVFPGVEREPAVALLADVLHDQNAGFVVAFNYETRFLAAPTNDLSTLEAAIRMATSDFRGSSALYDTLDFSATRLRADESVARVLIVVSDCDDNASVAEPDKVLQILQRTKTRLYAVVIQSAGESTRHRSARARRSIEWLAKSTGGTAPLATKPEHVQAAFRQIAEDLRGVYLLEFRSVGPTREGRLHPIKVEALRKDLRVSAPEGYFSPKN